MKRLIKIGQALYGIGIAALGVHQLITRSFRPEIVPPFPAWQPSPVFPILTGMVLILTGAIISGVFKFKLINTKRICLYLGLIFLTLIIIFHLPYILLFSPHKALRLDVWFGAGEALAYGGGALVMAGSFRDYPLHEKNIIESTLQRLIPYGRIFYAVLIILFGCSHFVFTDFVSTMVPKWLGSPTFWTYFTGAALIASGIALIFKIWIKPVALLLAIMLFFFFLLFHIPDAIANPYAGGGNEIIRAIIALLFCGIALAIASTGSELHR